MKVPFIISADLDSLLEKMNTCYDNPEKLSTTKLNKHTPFDTTKIKLDYYRGKNYIKKISLDLREHATKIITDERKEIIPLAKKEGKKHNKQKVCHICKKKI